VAIAVILDCPGATSFAQEKIAPITQEVGFEGPPDTTILEVHNYLTAG
jgi:hypothetical protein